MAWCSPISARLLIVGLLAVTAIPPFGPFFSELRVVGAGLATGHGGAVAVFVICVLLAFLGLTRLMFAIVDGRPRGPAREERRASGRESAGVVVPPLLFLCLSLWLGLAAPSLLQQSWRAAATFLHPLR
jgi:hydrogenase-4 component F